MVPNFSSISQLDPFLDSDNIIRVGGRLRKSSLTEAEQHPVIIPKNSAVSDAIIQWSHTSVVYGARGLTLNHFRNSGIWIISANAAVRRVIHRCVTCCKLRGKTSFQKMADLPVERCTEVAPFTYCGVDIFGPYLIKEKRSQLKRYGALLTCFTCRATHIEVTNAFDTNSFILALKRFMARRGAVRSICSDNGINFVGTRNELQQRFKEMNHGKIKNFFQENGQIGLTGIIIHQQHYIWVAFGNVKSEQQEIY